MTKYQLPVCREAEYRKFLRTLPFVNTSRHFKGLTLEENIVCAMRLDQLGNTISLNILSANGVDLFFFFLIS